MDSSSQSKKIPVLENGELSSIATRPQLWGRRFEYRTNGGTTMHLHIPLHYGADVVLSKWPMIVFLEDVPTGINEELHIPWSSGSWSQEYVDDSSTKKTLNKQIPFVLASPISNGTPWIDRIQEISKALAEVVSSLFVSKRRSYLLGAGAGATAALHWIANYQSEFQVAAATIVCPKYSDQLKLQTKSWTCPIYLMVDKSDPRNEWVVDKVLALQSSCAPAADKYQICSLETDGTNESTVDAVTQSLRSPEAFTWMLRFSLVENLGRSNEPMPMHEVLSFVLNKVKDDEKHYVDVYGISKGLQEFEHQIGKILGKESAMFSTTGTCANFAAVRTAVSERSREINASRVSSGMQSSTASLLLNRATAVRTNQDSLTVLLHWTSHMVHLTHLIDGTIQREAFSQLAQKNLFGLQVVPYGVMHKAPTYNDIYRELNREDFSPAVLVIEIPHRMNGGATISIEDLRQIRSICQKRNVHMHMDGARLWEAQPHYNRSLTEICSLFDSVYVSFYKGLGAVSGAMLAGDTSFINAAKGWRHRLGGTPYTFTPAWMDCQRVINSESIAPRFERRYNQLHRIVTALKDERIVFPGGLIKFFPEVPESCMIHVYIQAPWDIVTAAHDIAKLRTSVVLWNKLRGVGFQSNYEKEKEGCYFEWTIGSGNVDVDLAEVVEGWSSFLTVLQTLLRQHGLNAPNRPARLPRTPSRMFVQKDLQKQWQAGNELSLPERFEPEVDVPRPEVMTIRVDGSLNAIPDDIED